MNCPYCAEEIKDEAVVCRHCGHDFSVVKPLLLRLIAAEKKVDGFTLPATPASDGTAPLQTFAALTAIAFCVLFTSGYLFISMAPLPRFIPSKVLAVLIPPLAMGLAAGSLWTYQRLRIYVFSGLVLGLLNLLCIRLLYASFEGLRFKWWWALVVFLLGQPFTFAFSAMVARSLRNRWSKLSAHPAHKDKDSDGFEKVSKKLTTTLDLLLKLLGLASALYTTIAATIKFFGGGTSS